MEKLLLKVEEVVEMTGICRSRVYEMVATGGLPTVRIGRSIRIPADRLKSWIEQATEGTDVSPA